MSTFAWCGERLPAQSKNSRLAISPLGKDAMAGKAADAAKGGIRAWLMPEINDIKVQLAEIKGELKATNSRIDSTNTRVEALASEIKELRESLSVVQRLAVLEVKVSEFEKKEKKS